MNTSHAQRSLSFLFPFYPFPSFSLLNHLLYHPFIPQRFISYTRARYVCIQSCVRFQNLWWRKKKKKKERESDFRGSRVIRADLRREESQPKESVQRDYIEARNIPIPRKIRRRPHVSHTAIPAALCPGKNMESWGASVCVPVRTCGKKG